MEAAEIDEEPLLVTELLAGPLYFLDFMVEDQYPQTPSHPLGK